MDDSAPNRPEQRGLYQSKRALSVRSVSILSEAYEISPASVSADAETVVDWCAPWDDLLVNLELRHGWGAEMAIHYLRTVLVGLNATEPAS